MTLIRFLKSDGSLDREVEAAEGDNLLDVAQDNEQPLEGTCGKCISCSTCHVIIAPEDFDRLPEASEEEEDLLDLAGNALRTSRLACQVRVNGPTMTVKMPG
nr:2Fe-2S iron-sulfur cluster-binding protein [uncultured Sphingomonas sp.]